MATVTLTFCDDDSRGVLTEYVFDPPLEKGCEPSGAQYIAIQFLNLIGSQSETHAQEGTTP